MLARIGHNNPPGPIDIGAQTLAEARKWLASNPIVENEDAAREAAKFSERCKISCDEIEKERDSKVRPLNNQVKEINQEYSTAKAPLEAIRTEIRKRLTAFAIAEEAKRVAIAEAARVAREDAERIARKAEAAEQEALSDASQGVVGVDVVAVTQEANQAFSRFQKADRAASVAAKESHVRIGSGIGRAATLKTKETLKLNDALKALTIMGVSEKTEEAILSDARAYRKQHGKLPEGVTSETTREI
jgi:hypothetical protein